MKWLFFSFKLSVFSKTSDMLKNNKLLIDQDCPMCCIYGKCFTKLEWVDQETLNPYQVIADHEAEGIDMDRAQNEIALKDQTTGTTVYGIDAMIKIVAHGNKGFDNLLNSSLVYGFLKRLYNFISYNRKVIYPTATNPALRKCHPGLNLKHRWAYILLVALLTGVILNSFVWHINMGFGLEHNWSREYYICFGQVIWQMAAIRLIAKEKTLDYLGNMSTVSLIGGLMLLPVLGLNALFHFPPLVLILLFGTIVSFMLLEHIRRCRLLGIPLTMTISWLLYRSMVLGLVLYLICFA